MENKSYKGGKSMSDFNKIYDWLKENCEPISNLWAVSSLLEDGFNMIQPNSSQNMYDVDYESYADSQRRYIFKPREPYFFDVDIICYRAAYTGHNDENLETLNEIQSVCDWLINQQNIGGVPTLTSAECYQVECLTPKPFIRGVYDWNGSPGGFIVDYAVTVRFYTDNPAKRRAVVRR